MASGRPDWYSSVAMHGKHNDDYITLAVDQLGNMLAKMTGAYNDALKTIAVDEKGVMLAMMTTPEVNHYHGDWTGINDGLSSMEYGEEGKGTLWSLLCRIQGVSVDAQSSFVLKIDGDSLYSLKVADLLRMGFVAGHGYPFSLLELDYSGVFNYSTQLTTRAIHFDTSFGVYFANRSGARINYLIQYNYTVI